MTSINENDDLRPVIAGQDLHIEPSDLKGFRPSYQFLAYVRKAAGGEISNDLLGTDRPKDIDKLYSQTEDWLQEAPKF